MEEALANLTKRYDSFEDFALDELAAESDGEALPVPFVDSPEGIISLPVAIIIGTQVRKEERERGDEQPATGARNIPAIPNTFVFIWVSSADRSTCFFSSFFSPVFQGWAGLVWRVPDLPAHPRCACSTSFRDMGSFDFVRSLPS